MDADQEKTKTRLESFRYAFSGLIHAIYSQKNFQIQLLIGVLVVFGAAIVGFNRIEWVVLIITIGLVLTAELLNTVIEVVVDLAVKEQLLPEAKLAKDVAAAAVLLLAGAAVIVGILLFAPYIW